MVEAELWTTFAWPSTAMLAPLVDMGIDLFSFDPDWPWQLPGRFCPCCFFHVEIVLSAKLYSHPRSPVLAFLYRCLCRIFALVCIVILWLFASSLQTFLCLDAESIQLVFMLLGEATHRNRRSHSIMKGDLWICLWSTTTLQLRVTCLLKLDLKPINLWS